MVQFFPAQPAVLAWPGMHMLSPAPEGVAWPSDPGSGGHRSPPADPRGRHWRKKSRDAMCAWTSGGVVWGCEKLSKCFGFSMAESTGVLVEEHVQAVRQKSAKSRSHPHDQTLLAKSRFLLKPFL
jgi:hypothetical protein